jgi:hypothetical protein
MFPDSNVIFPVFHFGKDNHFLWERQKIRQPDVILSDSSHRIA